jgi:hypothetical protein
MSNLTIIRKVNKAKISREHCAITINQNAFYLSDKFVEFFELKDSDKLLFSTDSKKIFVQKSNSEDAFSIRLNKKEAYGAYSFRSKCLLSNIMDIIGDFRSVSFILNTTPHHNEWFELILESEKRTIKNEGDE